MDSRKITNKLLEMVDEGLLDARTLALACLKYMSEEEVEDMAKANEFLEDEEKEDEQSCPYLIFGGRTKDTLQPISAWPTKESAIEGAKICLLEVVEVVYMPEDDIDTNEVVWANYKR